MKGLLLERFGVVVLRDSSHRTSKSIQEWRGLANLVVLRPASSTEEQWRASQVFSSSLSATGLLLIGGSKSVKEKSQSHLRPVSKQYTDHILPANKIGQSNTAWLGWVVVEISLVQEANFSMRNRSIWNRVTRTESLVPDSRSASYFWIQGYNEERSGGVGYSGFGSFGFFLILFIPFGLDPTEFKMNFASFSCRYASSQGCNWRNHFFRTGFNFFCFPSSASGFLSFWNFSEYS